MLKKLLVLGLVLGCGQVAEGQTIENHYAVLSDSFLTAEMSDFVDIPESGRTVVIPPGKVFFTWSIHMNGTGAFFRPAIGSLVPPGEPEIRSTGVQTGSWVTTTTGGSYLVRLQFKASGSSTTVSTGGASPVSWTLMVFPEAAVPAVGGLGLLVIAASMLAAGAWILSKRRNVAVG